MRCLLTIFDASQGPRGDEVPSCAVPIPSAWTVEARRMIVSHIIGGLGNQMFQYAMGRALSIAEQAGPETGTFPISKITNCIRDLSCSGYSILISIATPSEIRDVLGWQASRFVKPWVMRPTLSGLQE